MSPLKTSNDIIAGNGMSPLKTSEVRNFDNSFGTQGWSQTRGLHFDGKTKKKTSKREREREVSSVKNLVIFKRKSLF